MNKTQLYLWMERVKSLILHVFLFGSLILMLTPFAWMISTSFKTRQESYSMPPTWIPDEITFSNYIELFQAVDFARPLMNSIIVAVATTSISLVVCAMAAYAITKFNFRGRKQTFLLILSTMMVPGQVTTIPVFLLMKKIGLVNTYTGIIIPAIASVSTIFFLRQFLTTISNDYIEAAKIEGAGEWTIFSKLIFPMMKPALITMGIFTFTGAWNSFFWPLIIATDDRFYTLPLAMTILNGQHGGNIGLNMAGAIVVILPLIVLFMFTQKYIIQSMNVGGLKG